MGPAPPSESSQVSVEDDVEWEIAIMLIFGWEAARLRRVRKVFSANWRGEGVSYGLDCGTDFRRRQLF